MHLGLLRALLGLIAGDTFGSFPEQTIILHASGVQAAQLCPTLRNSAQRNIDGCKRSIIAKLALVILAKEQHPLEVTTVPAIEKEPRPVILTVDIS